jgi:phosphate transport system substrate-binding protein
MKKLLAVIVVIVLLAAGALIIRNNNAGQAQNGNTNPNVAAANNEIIIKGSDSEVQLVSNLAEAFSKSVPDAHVSVTGGGTGVGIEALLNNEADLATASRKIEAQELQRGKDAGQDIKEFILVRDGVTLISNSENKIASLTVDQLGKIFRGDITNWKDLGGKDAAITLYGRQNTSGTYVYFRDTVLKADYSSKMKNMEGNATIVSAVQGDVNGIGYVAVGYVKDDSGKVKTGLNVINLKATDSADAVSPLDEASVESGKYALSRPLFHYLSKLPEKGSLVEKFLSFEMTDAAKDIIKKAGYYPRTAEEQTQNQALLDQIK